MAHASRAVGTDGVVQEADEDRVKALHDEAIVIDGSIVVETSEEHIQRFRRGGVTAINHTVTTPYGDLPSALKQISQFRRWIDDHAQDLLLATSVADIRQAKDTSREAIIFGPQDTEMIGLDLGLLGTFHDLGVRVLQLTYQRQNWIGSGCGERSDDGLSGYGREFVSEMDALGIVIDVSHCGERTGLDAIETSSNPVVVSHSFAARLSPHIRAKSDEFIQALGESGGLIGITGLSPFLYWPDEPTRRPTMARFVEHVTHVVELAGIDHVAVGLDFDETFTPEKRAEGARQHGNLLGQWPWPERRCEDLEDAGDFPSITRALAGAGYSDDDILKVLGGNWLRVFSAVWK